MCNFRNKSNTRQCGYKIQNKPQYEKKLWKKEEKNVNNQSMYKKFPHMSCIIMVRPQLRIGHKDSSVSMRIEFQRLTKTLNQTCGNIIDRLQVLGRYIHSCNSGLINYDGNRDHTITSSRFQNFLAAEILDLKLICNNLHQCRQYLPKQYLLTFKSATY